MERYRRREGTEGSGGEEAETMDRVVGVTGVCLGGGWMGGLGIGKRSRISVWLKSVSLCPLKVRFHAKMWLSAYKCLRGVARGRRDDNEAL